ncbi:hypothetical protein MLD38_007303 [Melastoma candidum]|uniref:Uncharacterized protein n=1 Tax=Melastoma candidum TaxID=119954 RepID=A0ACB9RQN0_9MYRT|nr:hypothetical protein MLD38_007303 [Melastoma candidum]
MGQRAMMGNMSGDNIEDDERDEKDQKATALDIAQIYCLRELLTDAILFKVRRPSATLPPVLGAYMYALACLLSYDGLSGISLPPPKSSESNSKPSKMTREPGREGPGAQLPSNLLASFLSPHGHHKPMDIDYNAGLENVVENYDNGSRSIHIQEQPLPFDQNAAFNLSTNEQYGNGLPRQSYYQKIPPGNHWSFPYNDPNAAFNIPMNRRYGNGSPRQSYYHEIPPGSCQSFPFDDHRAGVDVRKRKVKGKGRSGRGIQQPATVAPKTPNQKTTKKVPVLVSYGAGTFGPYGPTRGDSLKRHWEIG